MKKKVMTLALMCLTVLSGKAQFYGYEQAIQLPTVDLYDDALMEMELRAARETAARRQQAFEYYGDQAYDAYCNNKWVDVINNVNSALNTGYYNGKLYFFRGYAYESLGYYKNAKKDYKLARKNGVSEANAALDRIKQKMKAKR
jgi:tetratricopeptide (TPR) repeat protein